eukprot:10455987-Alexandrium_andersonii.AAC.1
MHCFWSSEWSSERRKCCLMPFGERDGPRCRPYALVPCAMAPAPMASERGSLHELRSVQLGGLE